MRCVLAVIAAVGLLFAGRAPIYAHETPIGSDPPMFSTVQLPPSQVSLSFTAAVDPAASWMTVVTLEGDRVDLENSYMAPESPGTLVVDLAPNLPPGWYAVTWVVTSAADGHLSNGRYTFQIAASSPSDETNPPVD